MNTSTTPLSFRDVFKDRSIRRLFSSVSARSGSHRGERADDAGGAGIANHQPGGFGRWCNGSEQTRASRSIAPVSSSRRPWSSASRSTGSVPRRQPPPRRSSHPWDRASGAAFGRRTVRDPEDTHRTRDDVGNAPPALCCAEDSPHDDRHPRGSPEWVGGPGDRGLRQGDHDGGGDARIGLLRSLHHYSPRRLCSSRRRRTTCWADRRCWRCSWRARWPSGRASGTCTSRERRCWSKSGCSDTTATEPDGSIGRRRGVSAGRAARLDPTAALRKE
jgi:hypothetical protein